MNKDPDLFSPNRRPDISLAAMILLAGLLLAWATSTMRDRGPVALSSGLLPIHPRLFSGPER